MPKLTDREKQLIRIAFRIATEDGSIYSTGVDADDDDKQRAALNKEIDTLLAKLH